MLIRIIIIKMFLTVGLIGCYKDELDDRRANVWPRARAFIDGCEESHNIYRANHQVEPLRTRIEKLRDAADRRAAILWAKYGGNLRHPNDPEFPYGENLVKWYTGEDGLRGEDCGKYVQMWYNETYLFDFDNGGFGHDTGHFTQLVWKNTKEVGCAIRTQGQTAIVSCAYDPPGNVQGGYRDNVLKLKQVQQIPSYRNYRYKIENGKGKTVKYLNRHYDHAIERNRGRGKGDNDVVVIAASQRRK